MTITITEEMREALKKPLPHDRKTWGGFQKLLFRLQMGIKFRAEGWTLEVSRSDAEAVLSYSSDYREGGYQNRLRPIVGLVREALAKLPPRPKQYGLFGEEVEEPAHV